MENLVTTRPMNHQLNDDRLTLLSILLFSTQQSTTWVITKVPFIQNLIQCIIYNIHAHNILHIPET